MSNAGSRTDTTLLVSSVCSDVLIYRMLDEAIGGLLPVAAVLSTTVLAYRFFEQIN